eukprot:10926410-Ditylum_brightwellii.AAC.1
MLANKAQLEVLHVRLTELESARVAHQDQEELQRKEKMEQMHSAFQELRDCVNARKKILRMLLGVPLRYWSGAQKRQSTKRTRWIKNSHRQESDCDAPCLCHGWNTTFLGWKKLIQSMSSGLRRKSCCII